MVIRYADVLDLMTVLAEDKKLQVTVTESAKGGLLAGGAATLGGLLLGPPGLAIGGAVGGCLAMYIANDKFRPVALVLTEDMTLAQQQKLVGAVTNIVSNLDAGDAMELIAIVQGNELLKARVMSEMCSFLRSNLSMHVID